jgi:hypothetical protein
VVKDLTERPELLADPNCHFKDLGGTLLRGVDKEDEIPEWGTHVLICPTQIVCSPIQVFANRAGVECLNQE